MKRNGIEKNEKMTIKKEKKKNLVSRGTNPSQSLEGATEIRKPRVRFPVEVRICFGVRMWLR
jgi:hypothetical protein